jgi:hypothetical protein
MRMALCITNGDAYMNLGLKIFRVQEKGAEPTLEVGQAGRLGPTGPVWLPLRSRGSSCNYALCPLHLHYFDNVILASKMEVLLA